MCLCDGDDKDNDEQQPTGWEQLKQMIYPMAFLYVAANAYSSYICLYVSVNNVCAAYCV